MKIHDGGWAWVVSGSKAYLWRHSLKQTTVCIDKGFSIHIEFIVVLRVRVFSSHCLLQQ